MTEVLQLAFSCILNIVKRRTSRHLGRATAEPKHRARRATAVLRVTAGMPVFWEIIVKSGCSNSRLSFSSTAVAASATDIKQNIPASSSSHRFASKACSEKSMNRSVNSFRNNSKASIVMSRTSIRNTLKVFLESESQFLVTSEGG
jgi:hypothetical protein